MLASQAIMLAVTNLSRAQIDFAIWYVQKEPTDKLNVASALVTRRENELGEFLKSLDDLADEVARLRSELDELTGDVRTIEVDCCGKGVR